MLYPRILPFAATSPSVAMSAERRTRIHPPKYGDPSKNFLRPLRHIRSFRLAQKPRRVRSHNCLCGDDLQSVCSLMETDSGLVGAAYRILSQATFLTKF